MKGLLLLALLLSGGSLPAQQIVVFGEKDFYVLESNSASPGPKEPGQSAFLESCRVSLARNLPFEESMELVNPPAWGKTVSTGTHGNIRFHPSFPHGFVCRLILENLLPSHDYILTLNGNPARAGNNLLRTPVPSGEQERYYDFLVARTDVYGRYDATLGVYLKPGAYDVRCYVKDTADFKIVLYRDFFKFTVE